MAVFIELYLHTINSIINSIMLFSYLRHPDMQYISMACTPEYVELTEKLLLLKNAVNEEQKQFDRFWSQHKALLDRVMNFALFDRSVNKVKYAYMYRHMFVVDIRILMDFVTS